MLTSQSTHIFVPSYLMQLQTHNNQQKRQRGLNQTNRSQELSNQIRWVRRLLYILYPKMPQSTHFFMSSFLMQVQTCNNQLRKVGEVKSSWEKNSLINMCVGLLLLPSMNSKNWSTKEGGENFCMSGREQGRYLDLTELSRQQSTSNLPNNLSNFNIFDVIMKWIFMNNHPFTTQ